MTLATLARDLVAIPSHEDETAAGDHVEDWLRRETAADVTRDDAGNVIARRGSGEPSLALVGHHDVVPPDERQVPGGTVDDTTEYVADIRGDRLHGRGSADMKGAVAAMLHAFRDADPSTELVFASFVGEEIGGEGAQYAVENGFAPDRAVVGEGSTGYSAAGVTDVAVAHKGRRGSTLAVHGTSAHASEPEAGDNAIYRACDVVDDLRGLSVPATTVRGESLAGSLAVTEINGGSAWNVIPERCTITVDERTVPGERAAIETVAESPAVEWTVDQDWPPMECDDPEFIEAGLAAARDAQDGTPAAVVKPHATDAGWLSQAGVSCVVCGPAEPGQAHTADESVSIPILNRCERLYRTLADRTGPG